MRTTLRSAALGAGRVRVIPARSIATSSPRRADHSHDSHSHGHNDISDAVTHESWLSSPWRNTFIITALAYVAYNYLPVGKASTPSTTAAEERAEYARTDANAPLVTRLIAKYTEDAKDLRKREKEHIESVSQHADSRIITMNAETPKVRQFRDPNSLYTASPYGIPVGAQADLSGFEWK